MAAKLTPSIFNDVLGPIMRGPSSSHSAASVRIGLLVHDLLGGPPDRVEIEYDSQGSLATTHESQGTDMGLYGGLLGWSADDPRLPDSPRALAAGCEIEVRKPRLDDAHPNTYRLSVVRGDERHTVVAVSTGGGMIEVVEIDGFDVELFGDTEVSLLLSGAAEVDGVARSAADDAMTDSVQVAVRAADDHRLVVARGRAPVGSDLDTHAGVRQVHRLRAVLPVRSRPDMVVPFTDASELDGPELERRPLSDWAIAFETARADIEEDVALKQAHQLLDIMRTGVETGLAGTEYADRILGWQSGRFTELEREGNLLDGGMLNTMIPYVTALMEAKSAMEVIVAAPTAGSCATFPGALLAAVDTLGTSAEAAQRALLTGGLIGIFVANRSSFAAEVGGCQAETGAGAAMAAAALVELGGGSAAQSLSAASQAIQNVLGLICDPVGNRVEAPCLGRNVAGAANALSCANMALAGYDHVVPLHEALDAHRQVSELMARELRCTGLGGLAITPTAQRIELDLQRHRARH